MAPSLPQPLGHILIGELDFLLGRTGAGELHSFGRVAQVTPHPSKLRRDGVFPVLLCDHLSKGSCNSVNGGRGNDHEKRPRPKVGHLDDVEFGQEVAVGQGQLVPVQEPALGFSHLSLAGEWTYQKLVQFSQSFVETLL